VTADDEVRRRKAQVETLISLIWFLAGWTAVFIGMMIGGYAVAVGLTIYVLNVCAAGFGGGPYVPLERWLERRLVEPAREKKRYGVVA